MVRLISESKAASFEVSAKGSEWKCCPSTIQDSAHRRLSDFSVHSHNASFTAIIMSY